MSPFSFFLGFFVPCPRGFTLFGGDDGIRTHDPLLAGQVLSQLSYTPILPYGCFYSVSLQVFFTLRYQSLKIEQQSMFCPSSLRQPLSRRLFVSLSISACLF